MLGTLLDKITGLFDKRFVVAYWSPVFIGLGLMVGLLFTLQEPVVNLSWWTNWNKLGAADQALFIGGVLLVITLIAFVLEILSEPILRLYEGYWPKVFNPIGRRLVNVQIIKLERLHEKVILQRERSQGNETQNNPSYKTLFEDFPFMRENMLPTRLGNILNAANEYSYVHYRLDAFIWWPRLAPLLPDNFRNRMDQTLYPVQALVNLSVIFALFTISGGVTLLIDRRWLFFGVVFICGLILSRMCFLMATSVARNYGDWVRAAYDLYRQEVLKQMHIPIPDNLIDERKLWSALNGWVYSNVSPWEVGLDLPQLTKPFFYDTYKKGYKQEIILGPHVKDNG